MQRVCRKYKEQQCFKKVKNPAYTRCTKLKTKSERKKCRQLHTKYQYKPFYCYVCDEYIPIEEIEHIEEVPQGEEIHEVVPAPGPIEEIIAHPEPGEVIAPVEDIIPEEEIIGEQYSDEEIARLIKDVVKKSYAFSFPQDRNRYREGLIRVAIDTLIGDKNAIDNYILGIGSNEFPPSDIGITEYSYKGV